jgi:flavin reductase (DIM6/NTAB) family NADH-FMN oxidoreductase RutF
MHHTTASKGMEAETYRALMRHQAGAVTVIAAGFAGARAGLTATAVASLSDEPPTILACIQRKAGAHDLIDETKCFTVNLLAADQKEVAERFAGRRGLFGEERFEALEWRRLATGAPVLVGALASLDCTLLERHAFSTHSIFIGRVVAGAMRAEAAPLLYFRNDYWDLGSR